MNAKFKPFDDIRVRQAVVLATDYAAMNQSVFENLGVRVRSIVSPTVSDMIEASKTERDVAKAKQLLAAAGMPTAST